MPLNRSIKSGIHEGTAKHSKFLEQYGKLCIYFLRKTYKAFTGFSIYITGKSQEPLF